ncbi:MAG: hypothetical protein ABEL76_00655 [Bradymonadaceae bacterium]
MKTCPSCGGQMSDEAAHCGHCGRELQPSGEEKETMFGMGTVSAEEVKEEVEARKEAARQSSDESPSEGGTGDGAGSGSADGERTEGSERREGSRDSRLDGADDGEPGIEEMDTPALDPDESPASLGLKDDGGEMDEEELVLSDTAPPSSVFEDEEQEPDIGSMGDLAEGRLDPPSPEEEGDASGSAPNLRGNTPNPEGGLSPVDVEDDGESAPATGTGSDPSGSTTGDVLDAPGSEESESSDGAPRGESESTETVQLGETDSPDEEFGDAEHPDTKIGMAEDPRPTRPMKPAEAPSSDSDAGMEGDRESSSPSPATDLAGDTVEQPAAGPDETVEDESVALADTDRDLGPPTESHTAEAPVSESTDETGGDDVLETAEPAPGEAEEPATDRPEPSRTREEDVSPDPDAARQAPDRSAGRTPTSGSETTEESDTGLKVLMVAVAVIGLALGISLVLLVMMMLGYL